ncbi:MAG: AAA family ATPase [bacterium]
MVIPWLKSIYIKNYRSISEVKIDFPKDKPVILIGENNSGKSNILRTIYLLFGDYDLASVKLNREDFNEALYRNTNKHNNSQINVTITAEVEDFTIEENKNIEKLNLITIMKEEKNVSLFWTMVKKRILYLSFLDGTYFNLLSKSNAEKISKQRNDIYKALKKYKNSFFVNTFGLKELCKNISK